MGYAHHLPLDPECPEVVEFNSSFWDDPPTTKDCEFSDEIFETWETEHRTQCERCRQYGYANIEVL